VVHIDAFFYEGDDNLSQRVRTLKAEYERAYDDALPVTVSREIESMPFIMEPHKYPDAPKEKFNIRTISVSDVLKLLSDLLPIKVMRQDGGVEIVAQDG
jgi:hypothetical protein